MKCVYDRPKEGFHLMFAQKFLISVLLLAFCCAIPASAALTTCTNTSCFATDATAEADTFQNIDVTVGGLPNPYTDLGAEFGDPAGLDGISDATGFPSEVSIEASATGASTITITLPSSVNAIEFYAGTQSDYSNFNISVTDNSGGTYSSGLFEQIPAGAAYFGVSTDSSFNTLTITSYIPGNVITIGDISIGTAASDGGGDPSPTPEAATLLLVGTGLFLMSYLKRRTPRRATVQAASRGTVRTMSTGITPA
jgi:hypothetical protein